MEALFEQLIASAQPEATHRAFAGSRNAPGEVEQFLAGGYRRQRYGRHAEHPDPEVAAPTIAATLRPFALRGECGRARMEALIELHVATAQRRVRSGRLPAVRTPQSSNAGARWRLPAQGGWFGAFVPDEDGAPRLAAASGCMPSASRRSGERIARFPAVMTTRAIAAAAVPGTDRHRDREVRATQAADRFVIGGRGPARCRSSSTRSVGFAHRRNAARRAAPRALDPARRRCRRNAHAGRDPTTARASPLAVRIGSVCRNATRSATSPSPRGARSIRVLPDCGVERLDAPLCM